MVETAVHVTNGKINDNSAFRSPSHKGGFYMRP